MLGKHRFSVAAPLLWNSLPLDLRTANSLPAFKNNLKTFLFRQDATERLWLQILVPDFGAIEILLLIFLLLVVLYA